MFYFKKAPAEESLQIFPQQTYTMSLDFSCHVQLVQHYEYDLLQKKKNPPLSSILKAIYTLFCTL